MVSKSEIALPCKEHVYCGWDLVEIITDFCPLRRERVQPAGWLEFFVNFLFFWFEFFVNFLSGSFREFGIPGNLFPGSLNKKFKHRYLRCFEFFVNFLSIFCWDSFREFPGEKTKNSGSSREFKQRIPAVPGSLNKELQTIPGVSAEMVLRQICPEKHQRKAEILHPHVKYIQSSR